MLTDSPSGIPPPARLAPPLGSPRPPPPSAALLGALRPHSLRQAVHALVSGGGLVSEDAQASPLPFSWVSLPQGRVPVWGVFHGNLLLSLVDQLAGIVENPLNFGNCILAAVNSYITPFVGSLRESCVSALHLL